MARTIAILGAGKLGITLSQLALRAGYSVRIAGSGDPSKIKLSVSVLAPGAIATTSVDAARQSDVIILALPLSKFRKLPKEELTGKLVIDAMNYWWEVDGPIEYILPSGMSSSETVQAFLSSSRIVKALNHMGYHDLHDEARSKKSPGRKAIAVAGDSKEDVRIVSSVIDSLGFDALYIGGLAKGKLLEPGGNVFGANVSAARLKQLI